MAAFLSLALYTVFIGLDAVYTPQYFLTFLFLRLGGHGRRRRHPAPAEQDQDEPRRHEPGPRPGPRRRRRDRRHDLHPRRLPDELLPGPEHHRHGHDRPHPPGLPLHDLPLRLDLVHVHDPQRDQVLRRPEGRGGRRARDRGLAFRRQQPDLPHVDHRRGRHRLVLHGEHPPPRAAQPPPARGDHGPAQGVEREAQEPRRAQDPVLRQRQPRAQDAAHAHAGPPQVPARGTDGEALAHAQGHARDDAAQRLQAAQAHQQPPRPEQARGRPDAAQGPERQPRRIRPAPARLGQAPGRPEADPPLFPAPARTPSN